MILIDAAGISEHIVAEVGSKHHACLDDKGIHTEVELYRREIGINCEVLSIVAVLKVRRKQ